ncbi:SpaH/EbpB family LPXTG-anchored major pilin [Corynebacterium propinquum]|uniref:SpaH/EbpB family LPXTG-anchored major pilin n=1 Tax=Corynebacterium propinquum TaxID=43769 RepID=A0ABT7G4T5_9CORY|nr:SpaH/EbpB family LPXTG-anchored major pilin [Corynebacterium propinquum]MDK4258833.1 SpaH/EbpB family LPXTG-anchored major pilin [Corynebacterium propinquum]MDK4298728.1 SpaH/EbpB family LPXTG-anchored major pilin [Corynebacterium propinquum]MDK4301757.1 SpaH/EbpB family LPXTG-anchored major pilin [Corynebacterium propinquum]
MVSFKSRVIAICAAGTLAIGSAAVAAPISFAQDTDAAVVEDSATAGAVDRPYGAPAPAGADLTVPDLDETRLVKEDQKAKLTIKKLLGDPQGDDTGVPSGDAETLAGTTFTIQRLYFDLTAQDGWRALNHYVQNPGEISEELNADGGEGAYTETQTTGTNGEAIFDELPIGVYLVTEEPREGYSASAPFLVSLPFSDGNDGVWKYERTVYPKNQALRPNKQVDAQGATLGSNMKYTINAPIPAGELSHLAITDELVSNLQLVTDNPAPVVSFSDGTTVDNGEARREQLTDNEDYVLETADNTLYVEFTESGLEKLQQARQNKPNLQVHVQFEAKVVSLPAPGESITNTAEVEYPNGATVTTDSPAAEDGAEQQPTRTDYANLTIKKYTDDQEDEVDLSGAEFNLYRCEAGELLGNPLGVSTSETLAADFDSTAATTLTTVKSGENEREGVFQGYGIPVRTFAAGTTATQDYNYCVVETKAPEGFVLNPEVHEVELQAATAGQAEQLFVQVENQRDKFLSSLPATGAWGIILVFLVGLGLLARGFYTSRKDGRATA